MKEERLSPGLSRYARVIARGHFHAVRCELQPGRQPATIEASPRRGALCCFLPVCCRSSPT